MIMLDIVIPTLAWMVVVNCLPPQKLTYTATYTVGEFQTKTGKSKSTTHTVTDKCFLERITTFDELHWKNMPFPFTNCVNDNMYEAYRTNRSTGRRALSVGLNFTCPTDKIISSYLNITTDFLTTTLGCATGIISINTKVIQSGQTICNIERDISSTESGIIHLFHQFPTKSRVSNGTIFYTLYDKQRLIYRNCSYMNNVSLEETTLNMRYLANKNKGHSRGFKGVILTADLLEHLEEEKLESLVRKEYKYIQLLHEGAPHPECLCPQGTTPDCSDPAQRMTGTDTATYYLPISGLQDGVLDPERFSLRYGYWAAPNTDLTIRISLKVPTLITGMKVYLTNQSFTVYREEMVIDNIIPQSLHFQKKLGLANIEYLMPDLCVCEWKFGSWNQSSVITKIIFMNFPGDRVADYTYYPRPFRFYNMLYEIVVVGRPLEPSDPTRCECFPGNGQEAEGCDDCGRCLCRNGMESGESGESDRICSPYVTHVTPSQGPLSGGTLITIYGRLLKPALQIDISARVTLGRNLTCSIVGDHLQDDRIVCKTNVGIMPDQTLPLEPELLLAGFPYKIRNLLQLNYTYTANPSITEILTSQPLCRNKFSITIISLGGSTLNDLMKLYYPSRQTKLTVTGQHLNAPTLIYLLIKDLDLLVGCLGEDNGYSMICEVPKMSFHGGDILNIGFTFDEVLVPGFQLLLHQEPSLYTTGHITKKWTISLQGDNLNVCHGGNDYRITVGEATCGIFFLNKSHILCSLTESDVTRNRDSDVLVALNGMSMKIAILDYPVSLENNEWKTPVLVVLAILVLCSVILGIGLTWKYKYSRNISGGTPTLPASIEMTQVSDSTTIQAPGTTGTDILEHLDPRLQAIIRPKLLECDYIEKHKRIGKGNFGKVFHGTINLAGGSVSVALKTLKDGTNSDKEDIEEFLTEATIMKDFCHPNVLCLIGVILTDLDIFVVLPYMVNGDLRKYIARQMFDFKTFFGFTLDVAKGMAYLASKHFIHRDLAARNCMVNAAGVVLIGDFGLAKDIYVADYYRPEGRDKPMPFKWMAPECLEEQCFTTKSDTWAYGIVMWEIYTQGDRPYLMVDNLDLHTYLLRGNRLKKPDNCPEPIFQIMIKCWQLETEQRPTFAELVDLLTEAAEQILAATKMESMTASSQSLTSICQSSTPDNNFVFRASESQCPLLDSDWDIHEDDMPDYLAPVPPEEECEGAVGGAPAHAATISSQDLAAIAVAMRDGSSAEDDAGYLKPVSTIFQLPVLRSVPQPQSMQQHSPERKHNVSSHDPAAIAAAMREGSSPEDEAGYLQPVSTSFQPTILTLPRRFPETKQIEKGN